jgi:hypothetical protein
VTRDTGTGSLAAYQVYIGREAVNHDWNVGRSLNEFNRPPANPSRHHPVFNLVTKVTNRDSKNGHAHASVELCVAGLIIISRWRPDQGLHRG